MIHICDGDHLQSTFVKQPTQAATGLTWVFLLHSEPTDDAAIQQTAEPTIKPEGSTLRI